MRAGELALSAKTQVAESHKEVSAMTMDLQVAYIVAGAVVALAVVGAIYFGS